MISQKPKYHRTAEAKDGIGNGIDRKALARTPAVQRLRIVSGGNLLARKSLGLSQGPRSQKLRPTFLVLGKAPLRA